MSELTRRTVLSGAAAANAIAPLAAPMGGFRRGPPAGTQVPGWYRYKVGSFEITVVTDGVNRFKLPDDHRRQCQKEEVNAALLAVHMEPDVFVGPYNPIVVNTGQKLVLIDTGTGEAAFQSDQGLERPVDDQHGCRRHRSQGDRCRHHLALSRRSRERPVEAPTVRWPFPMPKFWCRRASTSSGWTTAR